MIQAVVFIPASAEPDHQFVREGIDHITRRRYRFAGIVRTIDDVHRALDDGAEVVIIARQEHWHPHLRVSAEIVGDETRRLAWAIPPKDRLENRRESDPDPGETTVEIDTRPAIPPRQRPTNDRATRLVDDAARRLGFNAQQPPHRYL